MLVHNCPRCNVTFQLVEGCSDVKCSQCGYSFCWVCGSNNDACYHHFMKIGCQVINLTFKVKIRSKFIRGLFIIVMIVILLPLMILLLFLCLMIVVFYEVFNPRYSNNRKCICCCIPKCLCDHVFWKYNPRSCCKRLLSRIFISIPIWTVYVVFSLALSLVLTLILLIPAWILAIISVIKMIIWWSKKDRSLPAPANGTSS